MITRTKKVASVQKVPARYRGIVIVFGTIMFGFLGALAAPSATETLYAWITGFVRPDKGAASSASILPATTDRTPITIEKKPGPQPLTGTGGTTSTTAPIVNGKTTSAPNPSAGAGNTKPKVETRASNDGFAFETTYPDARKPESVLPFLLLGAMLGAFISFQFLNFAEFMMARWDKMDSAERLVRISGIIIGLIVSFPFIIFVGALGLPGALLPWVYLVLMAGSLTICSYLAMQVSEVIPGARSRGPMRRTGIKLLDTNVIIDGRIYEVAKNGFLEGKLYLPRFVLEELQHIADHHDALRRQRGKRGLEVLNLLQADFEIEAGTKDHFAGDPSEPVDSRLVKLARAIGADLVTNDHNLNRVASLQDVRVLNINDLALALRPNVLPSENLRLQIIKEGNQFGQGVGYLDDGTMVVVENGRTRIGETVDICVTQVIQTERGKMIFGEIGGEVEEIYPRRRGGNGNGPGPRRA